MKKTIIATLLASALPLFLAGCPSGTPTQSSASDVASASSPVIQTSTSQSVVNTNDLGALAQNKIPMSMDEINKLQSELQKSEGIENLNKRVEHINKVLKTVPVTDEIKKDFDNKLKDTMSEQAVTAIADNERDVLLKLFAVSQYALQHNLNEVNQAVPSMVANHSEGVNMVLKQFLDFPFKGQYNKAETKAEKEVLAKIVENFKKNYPNDDKNIPKINVVKEFAVKGLFIVFINDVPSAMMTNANADYFITLTQPNKALNMGMNGVLSQTYSNIALNTPESQAVYKDIVSLLKPSIKHVYGKGERKIYVFSDPDCPYCRAQDIALHDGLTEADNVTIYQIMNPLQELHPTAYPKAAHLLCLENPSASWLDMQRNDGEATGFNPKGYDPKLYKGKTIESCLELVSKDKGLSEALGLNTTPTTIMDNGIVLMGQRSPNDIRKALQGEVPKDMHIGNSDNQEVPPFVQENTNK